VAKNHAHPVFFLEQKMNDPLQRTLAAGVTVFLNDGAAIGAVLYRARQLRRQGWRVFSRTIRRPHEGWGRIFWAE
jgi:hypothetical protein